jgi:glycosyltransferase involved in cell wall biosynthesis
VVIPVYGRKAFLKEALESVLNQTHPPDEVIVVDDGSGPQNRELLESCATVAKVIRLAQNHGPAHARNVGAAVARSDLLAFQDSDDLWEPTKLETQLAYLAAHRDCAAVHTGVVVLRDDGTEARYLDKPSPLCLKEVLVESHVTPPSLVIRADVFRAVGGFDVHFRSSEDYDLTIRLVASGYRIDFLPLPLIRVRRHGQGNLTSKWHRTLRGHLQVVWKHRRLYQEAFGPSAVREHMARHLRGAGLQHGRILGRGMFATGWLLGRRIAV